MRELLMLDTIIAVAFCLGYVLYQNGVLVINAKSAQLIIYGVAPFRKKEELPTGQVFRLQRRDKKGDSPPARGKIPVCLFNEPDKRKGLH